METDISSCKKKKSASEVINICFKNSTIKIYNNLLFDRNRELEFEEFLVILYLMTGHKFSTSPFLFPSFSCPKNVSY